MKRFLSLRTTLAPLLILTAAAASVVGWSSRQQPTSNNPIRIENKTKSLIVESVADDDKYPFIPPRGRRQVRLTLRNGYSQPVSAYSFRQKDISVREKDISGFSTSGATIGWTLASNETNVRGISVAAKGEVVLILLAVMLEDGTGDGDPDELAYLKNYRAGVKKAYQEIVPMLREAAASGETVTAETSLQSLKSEIESIAEGSFYLAGFQNGVIDGKALAGSEIKELEDRLRSRREFDHRAGLKKILSQIEEYLAKL